MKNKETMTIIIWTLGLCAIMFSLALTSFVVGQDSKKINIHLTDNKGNKYINTRVVDSISIDCRTLTTEDL